MRTCAVGSPVGGAQVSPFHRLTRTGGSPSDCSRKRSSFPSSEAGAVVGAASAAGSRRPAPPPLSNSWGTAPSGRPVAPLACCKLLVSIQLLLVLQFYNAPRLPRLRSVVCTQTHRWAEGGPANRRCWGRWLN